ncbi:cytochrome c oxidase assembly protein [Bradyrhizobium sp. STM 3557]|uniref:cytochrome c oxidase assembly protein n=1 Tax=Bradyrhizobium sp. STM 3557 TaxID=578920 RepID=UPI0038900196
MRTLILLALVTATFGRAAHAHGEAANDLHAVWTFDPWIVAPLVMVAVLYGAGSWRLRSRGRRGKMPGLRPLAFWFGWISLGAALTSPLHWLGEHLFTFHMIEHEILMAISAPLMVAARPLGIMLWALPRASRWQTAALLRSWPVRGIWRALASGGTATLLHGVAIWIWHAPLLFDAVVENIMLHRLQHVSFFASAVLFWWAVLWRSPAGAAAWHVFITMLHTSVLGALMALAPRVLYGAQTAAAAHWGLTPLEDQQLAGVIMWVPAGTIYAGAALALLALWIRRSSDQARQADVLRPL